MIDSARPAQYPALSCTPYLSATPETCADLTASIVPQDCERGDNDCLADYTIAATQDGILCGCLSAASQLEEESKTIVSAQCAQVVGITCENNAISVTVGATIIALAVLLY